MARRRTWSVVVSLAMVVCLLAGALWIETGARGGALAEGEAQGSAVRVLLTRVREQQLTITLDGSYSMEPGGIVFQRGSKLVIDNQPGMLMLRYEGLMMPLARIELRRHALSEAAAGQENGMRFNGAMSLYGGDLTLTPSEEGVRPVLSLPMEEYLLGVVPYEMSNSFPLEALKAQAVTARTYAQRKLGAKQDYDVTDNTNDQVYKGYNPGHDRAAQAIAETAGICGYVNNELARCYYSASNGGQTELMQNVWPDGGKELFAVQDDPYDLQNPRSQVERVLIPLKWPARGQEGKLAQLDAMIRAAASEPLAALGYDGDAAYIRVMAVEAAAVHTPKFADPSRMMTQLRLKVQVDARREIPAPIPTATPKPTKAPKDATAAPEESAQPVATAMPPPQWTAMSRVPQAIEIDVPLFPDLEVSLGLSINRDGNEIITVAPQEDGFALEARRFGHGVGMSQRGAEWMAGAEGWTYEKILAFYYPRIKLRIADRKSAATLPPPVDAAFLNTPGPPPTATPRPTLMPLTEAAGAGLWSGKVTGIAGDSWLNLRAQPNAQSEILYTLYLEQPLLVVEELAEGWLRVKTDVREGYVMADFVARDGAENPAAPAPEATPEG